MSNVKSRMQSLGLLDRAVKATPDEQLSGAIAELPDDHREALEQFVADLSDIDALRDAVRAGRLDGGMEAIAAIVTDKCLSDCIEQLGDHAENPSSDQLREVLPGVIERHGLGVTQMMLASTVAGEAPASAIIRDLLKHDDDLALPKAEATPLAPVVNHSRRSDDEQAELREARKAARKAKQEAERARKAQAAAARKKR